MPNWKYANTISDVLTELRKSMTSNENRRKTQPPEGVQYNP